jgi:hypothetical protein
VAVVEHLVITGVHQPHLVVLVEVVQVLLHRALMVHLVLLILEAVAVALLLEARKVMAVLAALALSSSVILVHSEAQAEQLHHQADTPSTHLLHQALTQHKGKTHVTFCKSSRRQGYTSYRC